MASSIGPFYLFNEAEKLERRKQSLLKGGRGEVAMYHVLTDQLLSRGYKVIHGIKPPRSSNIDFVVIGPTGVFVIEVKSLGGKINWAEKCFYQNGVPAEDFVKQTKWEAFMVHNAILKLLGLDMYVEPILLFYKPNLLIAPEKIDAVRIATNSNICKIIQQEYSIKNYPLEDIYNSLIKFQKDPACLESEFFAPVPAKAGFIGGHVNLCKHIADLDIHEA